MVHYYDLVLLVLVEVELWEVLISLDAGTWVVYCLFDVELLVLLWLS